MRIARSFPAFLLPLALPLRQTDGRTGGHGTIFIMFTAYAVRVITTNK